MCLKAADRLVPVSAGLLPGLLALDLDGRQVPVVEDGSDAAAISALAAGPLPIDLPELPVVAGLGRLSHEKGFDLLVRAHAGALAKVHRCIG